MKPCIRGLEQFRKKGCPENSSCPAWIETLGKLHPQIIRKCVDITIVDLLWDLNCNATGIQSATESFRNGMCEVSSEGKVVPKHVHIALDVNNLLNRQGQKEVKYIEGELSDE